MFKYRGAAQLARTFPPVFADRGMYLQQGIGKLPSNFLAFE